MSRVSRARRVAVTAAYGGGTVGAAGALLLAMLAGQARLARRAVGEPATPAPAADGLYGPNPNQPDPAPEEAGLAPADGAGSLVLAVLGDSRAAGFGVDRAGQTPGALIAAGLAEAAGAPVRLVTAAVVGARSADLRDQVAAVREHRPHVAVVLVGANDVTHRVRPATSVRHLAQAVGDLVAAGAAVVVGTCPDLGTVEPIAQPLRLVARRWSRTLAASQTIAAVEAGARTVSMGDLLGPEFAASPGVLFSADGFHPSASGYARVASALLPSVLVALGLSPDEPPALAPPGGVQSLVEAAVTAVEEAGTEVSGIDIAGQARGPWGRWVVLRHRARRAVASRHD